MDTQNPWQPGQNPEPGSEAPPSGPYNPPAAQPPYQPGGYAPPQGGYAPPEGSGGGYAPQPGGYPPPPPQKKGFNWLACCGISCGVVLLIGVIVFAVMFKSCSGIVGMGMRMQKAQQTVIATDANTIKTSATPLSKEQLNADLKGNEGKWIALSGSIGVDSNGMGQSMGSNGQQVPSTNYFIEPNIVIMDLSAAPSKGSIGDTITAYGQYTVMDLKDIPIVGKMIEEQAKTDPKMAGITQFVMFMAKEVEVTPGTGGSETTPPDSSGNQWGGGESGGQPIDGGGPPST